jgi:hypothetical protein
MKTMVTWNVRQSNIGERGVRTFTESLETVESIKSPRNMLSGWSLASESDP